MCNIMQAVLPWRPYIRLWHNTLRGKWILQNTYTAEPFKMWCDAQLTSQYQACLNITLTCPSQTSTNRMFIRDDMNALWEKVQANRCWNWFNGFVVKNKNTNRDLFMGSFYKFSVLSAIDLCWLPVRFFVCSDSCVMWKVTDVSGKEE
jgi:hypothetical protein